MSRLADHLERQAYDDSNAAIAYGLLRVAEEIAGIATAINDSAPEFASSIAKSIDCIAQRIADDRAIGR